MAILTMTRDNIATALVTRDAYSTRHAEVMNHHRMFRGITESIKRRQTLNISIFRCQVNSAPSARKRSGLHVPYRAASCRTSRTSIFGSNVLRGSGTEHYFRLFLPKTNSPQHPSGPVTWCSDRTCLSSYATSTSFPP